MSWRLDELEYVKCNFCLASNSRKIVCRPDGLNIVECQTCGLAYVNPRPKLEHINRIYSSSYFKKDSETGRSIPSNLSNNFRSLVGYQDYKLHSPPSLAPAANYELDIVEHHYSLRNASMLEIGCATGMLMQTAKLRGAKPYGIDISEHAVRIAKEHYGLNAHVATINELPSTEKFDVVIAFEVIEHAPDPQLFLNHVRGAVNSVGVVAITTPNYANSFICGKDWMGFHMSMEHLYYFSDEVLTRIARKAGLETIEIRTMGEGLSSMKFSKGTRSLRRMLGGIPILSNSVRRYRKRKGITPWLNNRDNYRILAIFRPTDLNPA